LLIITYIAAVSFSCSVGAIVCALHRRQGRRSTCCTVYSLIGRWLAARGILTRTSTLSLLTHWSWCAIASLNRRSGKLTY